MDKIEKLNVLKVTECSKDWEYYINRSERKINELVEECNKMMMKGENNNDNKRI